MEVTVDLDFAKPDSVEIYVEQIQSALSSREKRSNSPIDEGWWFRRLQHDAGQIDVAPAFDVELRIAVDLCLRDCTREQNKVKVVFGSGTLGQVGVKPGPRSMITISFKPLQSCN